MRLRTRLQTELETRLMALLPEAVDTVWDAASVVIAIEKLDFKSDGGFVDVWQNQASFKGFVRAEIRADAIDTLVVEPLIADLVTRPIVLPFDPEVELGSISENVRIILAEWKDTIRDQDVASGLRFSVEGVLASHVGAELAPGREAGVMFGGRP